VPLLVWNPLSDRVACNPPMCRVGVLWMVVLALLWGCGGPAVAPAAPLQPAQTTTATRQSETAASSPNSLQGSSTTSTPVISERLTALVIGNSAYESAPLANPQNDARAMASALAELGFEVDQRTNVDQREMKRAIRDFGQRIALGGVGLFYFAGHGMQVGGNNYLIPTKADIQKEVDVDLEGVRVDSVLTEMDAAQNRLNMVILDACRNNPFQRSFRSAARGLAFTEAPNGTLIAYATAPGSVAADGDGENGIYTGALLRNLKVPGVTVEQMFKTVRVQVRNATGGAQTPWESSSLTGDFYFARRLLDEGETCPEGTVRRGLECVANVTMECPSGMLFEPGKGCIPRLETTCPFGGAFQPGVGCVSGPAERGAETTAVSLGFYSKQPDITFWLADPKAEGGYQKLCVAPCRASVNRGWQRFAISEGDDEPKPAMAAMNVATSATLSGEPPESPVAGVRNTFRYVGGGMLLVGAGLATYGIVDEQDGLIYSGAVIGGLGGLFFGITYTLNAPEQPLSLTLTPDVQ
jgi:hypothetical protein